jgi:hypothetical protein
MKTVTNTRRNSMIDGCCFWLSSRLFLHGAVVCALLFALSGCMLSSISESSGSISDSSTSSSKSSRSSSDEEKEAYRRDVKQYTAVYFRANKELNGFTEGLTAISEKYGVTDWEADSATFLGIGEGFAKAALTQSQVERNAALLAQGDQVKIAAILDGFRTGL